MKNFAKLLTNPSFQTTTLGSTIQYEHLTDQALMDTYLPGWTLDSGNVDIQGIYDGSASNNTVDLYGKDQLGQISQTVTTVIGQTYFFEFKAVAGEGGAVPSFEIMINGVGLIPAGKSSSIVTPPDTSNNQSSTTQMVTYRYEFTATSTSTTLAVAQRGTINPNGTGVFTDGFNSAIPHCFVKGSLIQTFGDEVRIEELKIGDLVLTAQHGFQPIRWIGSQKIEGKGRFAPILFKTNSVQNDRDLMVSPEHRMFIDHPVNELLFGTSEFLLAAKFMVDGENIMQVEMDEVEYFHILFDQHEIIYSSGATSESFHPGIENFTGLSSATREEIYEIFPVLRSNLDNYGPTAVGVMKKHEAIVFNNYISGKTTIY